MTDTSREAVEKAISMAGLHGLHGTQEILRALLAEREALREEVEALRGPDEDECYTPSETPWGGTLITKAWSDWFLKNFHPKDTQEFPSTAAKGEGA